MNCVRSGTAVRTTYTTTYYHVKGPFPLIDLASAAEQIPHGCPRTYRTYCIDVRQKSLICQIQFFHVPIYLSKISWIFLLLILGSLEFLAVAHIMHYHYVVSVRTYCTYSINLSFGTYQQNLSKISWIFRCLLRTYVYVSTYYGIVRTELNSHSQLIRTLNVPTPAPYDVLSSIASKSYIKVHSKFAIASQSAFQLCEFIP